MMTCTSFVLLGSTNPLLGRTQYFLGEVVFTLNATRSLVGFVRDSVTGMFFRSSNLQATGHRGTGRRRAGRHSPVGRRRPRPALALQQAATAAKVAPELELQRGNLEEVFTGHSAPGCPAAKTDSPDRQAPGP